MPELSLFHEPRTQHHRPHFHAVFQGHRAVYAVDQIERLAGSLPNRQERMVLAWAEIHQDELGAAWERLQQGRLPERIAPLT